MPTPAASSFLSSTLTRKTRRKETESHISTPGMNGSHQQSTPIVRPPRKSSMGIPFQRNALTEDSNKISQNPSTVSDGNKRKSLFVQPAEMLVLPPKSHTHERATSPTANSVPPLFTTAPTASVSPSVAVGPIPPPPPPKSPIPNLNNNLNAGLPGKSFTPVSAHNHKPTHVSVNTNSSPKTRRLDPPRPESPTTPTGGKSSRSNKQVKPDGPSSSPKPSTSTMPSPKVSKASAPPAGTATSKGGHNSNTAAPSSSTTSGSSSRKPLTVVGQYQLHKTLGSGSMGKVKLAMNINTGQVFACKIIPTNKTSSGEPQVIIDQRKQRQHTLSQDQHVPYQISVKSFQKECFKTFEKPMTKADMDESRILREIQFSFLLRHPSIVPLHEVVVTPEYFYLFFDYVQGGQLLDFIIAHGRIKEKYARSFMRQLISAVEYCHAHAVVHRDLKIENVLIDKKGKIKLIDFGLANVYAPNHLLSTFCGSLYFAAPELLSAKRYIGPEVDVWSLGVIMFVLVCGRVPFDDSSLTALHARIKSGVVEYPTFLSPDCIDLLKRMLVVNPFQRATLKEIKYHPWMVSDHNGAADPFIPQRPEITLPLDLDVIEHMGGLDLGSPEEIYERLEAWAKGDRDVKYTRAYTNSLIKAGLIKGPGNPLVPLYHLVKEHLDRVEAAKQAAAEAAAAASQEQTPQVASESTSDKPGLLRRVSNRARGLFQNKTSSASPAPSKASLPVSTNDTPAATSQHTPLTPPRTDSNGPTPPSSTPDKSLDPVELSKQEYPLPAEPPRARHHRRPSQFQLESEYSDAKMVNVSQPSFRERSASISSRDTKARRPGPGAIATSSPSQNHLVNVFQDSPVSPTGDSFADDLHHSSNYRSKKSFDASSWFASLKRGSRKSIAQDVFQDDDAPPLPHSGVNGTETGASGSGAGILAKPFEFLKRRISMAHRSVRSFHTTDSRMDQDEDVPPMPTTTPFGQPLKVTPTLEAAVIPDNHQSSGNYNKPVASSSKFGSGIKSFFSSFTMKRKKNDEAPETTLSGTMSKNSLSIGTPKMERLDSLQDGPPVLSLRHQEPSDSPNLASYLSMGRGRKSEKSIPGKVSGRSRSRAAASPARASSIMSRGGGDKHSLFRFGGESSHFFGSLFRKKKGTESTYSFHIGDEELVPPLPPVPQSLLANVDGKETMRRPSMTPTISAVNDASTPTLAVTEHPASNSSPSAEDERARKQLALNTLKALSKSTKSLLQSSNTQPDTAGSASSPSNSTKTPTETIGTMHSARREESTSSEQARLMDFDRSGTPVNSSSIADLPGQIDDVVEKVSWKGLFSVANTSTRPPHEIAARLRLVLDCLTGKGYYGTALRYVEKRGTMLITLKSKSKPFPVRSSSVQRRSTLIAATRSMTPETDELPLASLPSSDVHHQIPPVARGRAHTVSNADRLSTFGLEPLEFSGSPLGIKTHLELKNMPSTADTDGILSNYVLIPPQEGGPNDVAVDYTTSSPTESAAPPHIKTSQEAEYCPPLPEKDYPVTPQGDSPSKTEPFTLPPVQTSPATDLLNIDEIVEGRGRQDTKRSSGRSIGVSLPPPRLRISRGPSDFMGVISTSPVTSSRSRSRPRNSSNRLSIFGDLNDRDTSSKRSAARRSRSAMRAPQMNEDDGPSRSEKHWQSPDSQSVASSGSDTTVGETTSNSMNRRQSTLLVQFQVNLCRITWLGLYGVRFHHLAGDSIAYKEVCEEILRMLCL